MSKVTTIQLEKKLVNELKEIKDSPEQTYNSLIYRMFRIYKSVKKNDQYDKFLHQVQQEKMRELWGSEEDEAWEDA